MNTLGLLQVNVKPSRFHEHSKNQIYFLIKLILIGQVFHLLLTNEHSLAYNQNDCFAFFLEAKRIIDTCYG